ncbi:MAG: C40 family peptidase [Muribaculum sp.]|nr:C40 family peptidase [Muribaculaceae bacterium]MCM1080658.1 C40 family peptidase [Muribaculum sp.]
MIRSKEIINLLLSIVLGWSASSCRTKRAVMPDNPTQQTMQIYPFPDPEHSSLLTHQKLLVDEAMTWIGTPYRYGGEDKTGADCSGLTMQVYKNALGILIPRNSSQQQQYCKTVSFGQIQAGDLIFFTTGSNKAKVSHVGLYIGNGYFIHSSGSRGVIISQLTEKYYTRNYHSSGHVTAIDKFVNSQKSKLQKDVPTIRFDQIPPAKQLETEPIRLELNKEIESKIDSVFSGLLD